MHIIQLYIYVLYHACIHETVKRRLRSGYANILFLSFHQTARISNVVQWRRPCINLKFSRQKKLFQYSFHIFSFQFPYHIYKIISLSSLYILFRFISSRILNPLPGANRVWSCRECWPDVYDRDDSYRVCVSGQWPATYGYISWMCVVVKLEQRLYWLYL